MHITPQNAIALFGFLARYMAIVASLSLTGCFGASTLTVREKTIVGHELRLVVETSNRTFPFWSHMATNRDAKGYLVIVDLESKLPMVQHSRIYGPLWDVRQPRSEISFDLGVNFTKEDVAAALATPRCSFDKQGQLIRYRTDTAHDQILFDRLELESATFKQVVAFAPIDNQTPPGSDDQVVSPSGRYMLLYQDNVARLYDLYAGQEMSDAWLTDRFAESRRITDFRNVSTFITDDLNHLIISPRTMWNEGFGAPVHKTFDFGGKKLSRAQYFLCSDRPEPSLREVERKADEQQFLDEAPEGAFIIDNQLMLMHATESSIRLYRPDGTVVYHSEERVMGGWRNVLSNILNLAEEGELVFFNANTADMDQLLERHIAFNIWDYRRGTVTRKVVPIVDLFQHSFGHYVPRIKPISVK